MNVCDAQRNISVFNYRFLLSRCFNCLVVLVVSCSSCLVCSVELAVCPMQLFHFWSREVVQNLLLCRKFHRSWMIFHWDTAIQRFSKWWPSTILNCFTTIRDNPRSLCCWPQLPVKFHGNLIHRSEDVAIWIFCIFGLKCLFRSPKWGFGGDFGPLNVIIYHRDLQKAHPCVNPRLLSYQL